MFCTVEISGLTLVWPWFDLGLTHAQWYTCLLGWWRKWTEGPVPEMRTESMSDPYFWPHICKGSFSTWKSKKTKGSFCKCLGKIGRYSAYLYSSTGLGRHYSCAAPRCDIPDFLWLNYCDTVMKKRPDLHTCCLQILSPDVLVWNGVVFFFFFFWGGELRGPVSNCNASLCALTVFYCCQRC